MLLPEVYNLIVIQITVAQRVKLYSQLVIHCELCAINSLSQPFLAILCGQRIAVDMGYHTLSKSERTACHLLLLS